MEDYVLMIIVLIVGAAMMRYGGEIVFTKKGLKKMYKAGYWKGEDPFFEKENVRFLDRFVTGGLIFVIALAVTFGTLMALLQKMGLISL